MIIRGVKGQKLPLNTIGREP